MAFFRTRITLNKKIKGFIFFYILIFLLLSLLFSYYLYYALILQLKLLEAYLGETQFAFNADKMLKEISRNIDPACFTNAPIFTRHLKSNSTTWWRENACHYKNDYYYLIEDLSYDNCAVIVNTDGKKIAHYFRFTLAYDNGFIKPFLCQSIIITASIKQSDCKRISHLVSPGIQGEVIL